MSDALPQECQSIGFLMVPDFALMSYASAIEPLRAVNRLYGAQLYRWVHISPTGQPVASSCGAQVPCEAKVGDMLDLDMLIVCAGGNPKMYRDKKTFAWIRKLASSGMPIAGVSGGPFLLARAGIMANHHMTIHWEHVTALTEEFPDHLLSRSLYVIDRKRLTCAGGVAALDMMHALIAERLGHEFATEVSDWFLHTDIRPAGGPQRRSITERYQVHRRELITALELMENNQSDPLSRQTIADRAGLSPRQLDRLFKAHIGTSFSQHYRNIRLQRARELLRQTPLSITEIALATGFANASHFSRNYKLYFHITPGSER